MFKTLSILKHAPYSIVIISIISVVPYSTIPLGNTTMWWFLQALILLVFFKIKILSRNKFADTLTIIQLYLIYNLFSIVRGVFIADTYWDWKGLIGNSMGLLMPIVAYSSLNLIFLQSIFRVFIKYCLPLFLFIFFIITKGSYGIYLAPLTFLLLFFPVLTNRQKLILIFFTLVVIFADLSARSNVIKFGVPILLLTVYYTRNVIGKRSLEFFRKLFFMIPLVLFSLAISGVFNIFNMQEYIDGDYNENKVNEKGEIIQESLTGDTRTLLYVEVLETAVKYNSWILGRSPARGNETELFASIAEITGKKERLGNEVAILNIFTWTGIIGIVLYMLAFYKASYLAINKSNNIYSKLLGLFVSFRWVYSWVEDINNFSLTTFVLWITIGLCMSKAFRSMSNYDIKCWVREIFSFNNRTIKNN